MRRAEKRKLITKEQEVEWLLLRCIQYLDSMTGTEAVNRLAGILGLAVQYKISLGKKFQTRVMKLAEKSQILALQQEKKERRQRLEKAKNHIESLLEKA
jgi:hypothetical protein